MKKQARRLSIATETIRQLRQLDQGHLRIASAGAEQAGSNVEICGYTTTSHPTRP